MVIVRLIGGLGNQLFQYAAGRRLAEHHRTELKLDVTSFDFYKLRTYGLGAFRIREIFAGPDEIARARSAAPSGIRGLLGRARRLFRSRPVFQKLVETQFCPLNADVLRSRADSYLDGYWQSEKYFADIESVIREEFEVKSLLSGDNLRLADEILGANSVSIHVRRGDYVTDRDSSRVHGICDLDYYQESARQMARRIRQPRFFVFSDDPLWVKENLKLPYPTEPVQHNDASADFEDLRLMSLCKHNIIANSSFSWWGAWLNRNPGKIVIAPRQWFADGTPDVRDLLPDNWLKA